MTIKKVSDFTGHSTSGIDDAIKDALAKAGDYQRVEIIETRGSQTGGDKSLFQVTLATYIE